MGSAHGWEIGEGCGFADADHAYVAVVVVELAAFLEERVLRGWGDVVAGVWAYEPARAALRGPDGRSDGADAAESVHVERGGCLCGDGAGVQVECVCEEFVVGVWLGELAAAHSCFKIPTESL